MRQRFSGTKVSYRRRGFYNLFYRVVGKHSNLLRRRRVTDAGAFGRENVGLSNRIARESRAHRKSKVSLAMVFNQGLVGPKAKPKGVVDGQPVNIPALGYNFNSKTKHSSFHGLLDFTFLH